MEAVYQYSGEVFVFTVYPDRLIIGRKRGLDKAAWCAMCGQPLGQSPVGQFHRYCSNVCRERDTDTREKTKWWKPAPVDSTCEEEASFPLIDIQAISGNKSGAVITVWTDETKGHDFYIDERNNFEALLNALDYAQHLYLDNLSRLAES